MNILLEWRYSHLHLRHNVKRIARMFAEKAAVLIREPMQTRTAEQSAAQEEDEIKWIIYKELLQRVFFSMRVIESYKMLCCRESPWTYLSESDWSCLLHIDEPEYLQQYVCVSNIPEVETMVKDDKSIVILIQTEKARIITDLFRKSARLQFENPKKVM